ncbi:MAG: glycosyltransferase family 2 protein [Candidatus Acidiferrales bacterium]
MTIINPKVFIVIAAYNESRTIRSVADKLLATYSDVVVIDDGSTDDTAARLTGSGARVLRHCLNRGQGAALQTGIRYALAQSADVIVTFDADGQHDQKNIEALIRPIIDGECDVTLGSRFLGRAHNIPASRKMMLKAGVLFTRIFSQVKVSDSHNGLRALSRRAAASLQITMDRMAHASEILDQIRRGGWTFREIPVDIYYSEYSLAKGQSSWNAIKIGLQILLKRAL